MVVESIVVVVVFAVVVVVAVGFTVVVAEVTCSELDYDCKRFMVEILHNSSDSERDFVKTKMYLSLLSNDLNLHGE